MKQTAVEWLAEKYDYAYWMVKRDEISPALAEEWKKHYLEKAKEMEKNNTDNKVIHFAEWLTNKHTSTLIALYEHFEEEYYNETFKQEEK